jgi:hypothetical protein
MAFDFFKKREPEYPAEEKAEILEPNLPSVSEMPSLEEIPMPEAEEEYPMPSAEEFGFRTPEELRPPALMPHEVPTSLPPFARPEPIPMPMPRPQPIGEFPPLRPPQKMMAPHIYVRVSKYKEVMDAINMLSRKIQETKNDLEDIHAISGQETEKIKEAAEVVIRMEELLKYLETTFTSPEE